MSTPSTNEAEMAPSLSEAEVRSRRVVPLTAPLATCRFNVAIEPLPAASGVVAAAEMVISPGVAVLATTDAVGFRSPAVTIGPVAGMESRVGS